MTKQTTIVVIGSLRVNFERLMKVIWHRNVTSSSFSSFTYIQRERERERIIIKTINKVIIIIIVVIIIIIIIIIRPLKLKLIKHTKALFLLFFTVAVQMINSKIRIE